MTVTTTSTDIGTGADRPTAYSLLAKTLAEHAYKRGAYVGNAPADPTRRSNTNFRVIKTTYGGLPALAVRLHRTDILTATQDGRLIVDCKGYENYPTTRKYLSDALARYNPARGYMGSHKVFGYSSPTVTMAGKTYRYYGGMEFDNTGALLTVPLPFRAKRIDAVRSKEFMADIKTSGFKAMFPVLHAVLPSTSQTYLYRAVRNMRDVLCNVELSDQWPDIIAANAYPGASYSFQHGYERSTAKECWSDIMKDVKHDMYEIVDSTTTVLCGNEKPVFVRSTPAAPSNPSV